MTFPELIHMYLDNLKGRSGHDRTVRVASQWVSTLTETPTRQQLIERHKEKGHGHYQPGASQANKELALVRAACRWGIYEGKWETDPTVGIKKWKTPKRKRICKYEEITKILHAFDFSTTDTEIRDRALFGIAMFTGCRPSEVRTALLNAITPYSHMGCWNKGTTKNGEDHEVPLPRQAMGWVSDWLKVRPRFDPRGANPYLFPGQAIGEPLSECGLRVRWAALRKGLEIQANLWNYDLRRTLASYLGNELKYDDKTIQAILNHYDGRAISHYYHVSFDALTSVVQRYADWLYSLTAEQAHTFTPVPPPATTVRLIPMQLAPTPPVLTIAAAPRAAVVCDYAMEWPG